MQIGDKVVILEDNLYDRYSLMFKKLNFKNTEINSTHFREGYIFGKTIHPEHGCILIAVESISGDLQALVDEENVYVIEKSLDKLTSDEINKLISKKEREIKNLKEAFDKKLVGQIGVFWDVDYPDRLIGRLTNVTSNGFIMNEMEFEYFEPLPEKEQESLRKHFKNAI